MNRKHIFAIFLSGILFYSGFSAAQDQESEGQLFVVLELMKVDNSQENAYAETENFWEKIHQERVKTGAIVGWHFWSLRPGGEHQGYQYMTATLYDDPVKMMEGDDILAALQNAYPEMSEKERNEKFEQTADSRDLGTRMYMELIARTEDDFEMKPGMVASMEMMKADLESYAAYETAEMGVFQPYQQQRVASGNLGSWVLLRSISPIGNDAYASHVTANMYEGWEQAMSAEFQPTDTASQEDVDAGLKTRDFKFGYLMVLEKIVN
ncbi:hypothetical protein [Marinimicrobium sp. C2-29]|uniref:hypothetical protein n=1 Tax=Marinimicrobium sp. C2-29 TaxID=3139825 RepID=UPI0031387769